MAPRPRAEAPLSASSEPRQAAVLIMLYFHRQQLHFSLIQRAIIVNRHDRHSGQMALPGGKREPDESLVTTALRETEEEIGVAASAISLLGELSPIDSYASHYRVYPFVGYYAGTPVFTPNADEVARIIEVPVTLLLDPSVQQLDYDEHPQLGRRTIPYFDFYNHKVWGLTAMILAEFMYLLVNFQKHRQVA
jgi:8-oxo-dGTP pyrophosphatase MutT (NUDIX family)